MAADAAASRADAATSLAASAAVVVLVLGLTAAVAWTGAQELAVRNAAAVAAGDVDTTVLADVRDPLAIAGRNLAAAALLAAGAPLAGSITVLAAAAMGAALGWGGAAVVGALGPALALERIAPYIVLELSGVVLAGAAGLLPVVHAIRRRRQVGFLSGYAQALPPALRAMAAAAILIVLGAIVEGVVIAHHD